MQYLILAAGIIFFKHNKDNDVLEYDYKANSISFEIREQPDEKYDKIYKLISLFKLITSIYFVKNCLNLSKISWFVFRMLLMGWSSSSFSVILL